MYTLCASVCLAAVLPRIPAAWPRPMNGKLGIVAKTTDTLGARSVRQTHQTCVRTYIFMVPFGPRFVFITSCRPLAPEMLMASACDARANSAFGFSRLIEDMFAA